MHKIHRHFGISSLYSFYETEKTKSFFKKKGKERVKLIGGGYKGSDREYKEIVLSYWEKFGIRPEKYWYDLFCSELNRYDPRFIPDSIWVGNILPYFNDLSMKKAYADKGMFNRLLSDVKKPETIAKNMGGYFYNGDGEQIVSKEEAVALCEKEEHLIIKPSLNSCGGSGIVFWDRGTQRKNINSIMDDFRRNYVIQRLVRQHPDLAALNNSTLNTVRVISFHFKDEVHILSAQLRIGGTGARVDNVSSGGSACAVKPDGWLHEQSVTRKSTWTDETSSGVKLKDVHVPNYEGIVQTAKRLHCQLPYFNIVGWDFAVGEDGSPILIEFNTKPGQNQIGGREPTFGDLTDEVLDEVFIKKTMKK